MHDVTDEAGHRDAAVLHLGVTQEADRRLVRLAPELALAQLERIEVALWNSGAGIPSPLAGYLHCTVRTVSSLYAAVQYARRRPYCSAVLCCCTVRAVLPPCRDDHRLYFARRLLHGYLCTTIHARTIYARPSVHGHLRTAISARRCVHRHRMTILAQLYICSQTLALCARLTTTGFCALAMSLRPPMSMDIEAATRDCGSAVGAV